MNKFEYKITGHYKTDTNTEEFINKMGKDGWELVSLFYYGNEDAYYKIFWKRTHRPQRF